MTTETKVLVRAFAVALFAAVAVAHVVAALVGGAA